MRPKPATAHTTELSKCLKVSKTTHLQCKWLQCQKLHFFPWWILPPTHFCGSLSLTCMYTSTRAVPYVSALSTTCNFGPHGCYPGYKLLTHMYVEIATLILCTSRIRSFPRDTTVHVQIMHEHIRTWCEILRVSLPHSSIRGTSFMAATAECSSRLSHLSLMAVDNISSPPSLESEMCSHPIPVSHNLAPAATNRLGWISSSSVTRHRWGSV